jgi:hypothetical protein
MGLITINKPSGKIKRKTYKWLPSLIRWAVVILMVDDFPGKILKKSDDDCRKWIESDRIDEGLLISDEKKSNNEIIREEFLYKRSLSKRIQNLQTIRKHFILIVKKR